MKSNILIFFICFIYTQNASPMLEGMGENRMIYDPAMIALGDSWYFSGRINGVGIRSISSLYNTNYSQISSSMSFVKTSSIDISIQKSHKMNYINFLVPIGIDKTIGFGLSPKTRSEFHITDKNEGSENIMYNGQFFSTDFIYFGKGGISDLFITYSALLNKNISFGIKWDIQFGNLFFVDSILTNTLSPIDYNTFQYNLLSIDRYESKYNFRGNSIAIAGSYINNVFNFSSSIIISNNMLIQNEKRFQASNNILFSGMDILSTSSKKIEKKTSIEKFGLGVEYKIMNNEGYIIEYNYVNNLNYNELNIFNNKKGIENKISLGYYKWLINMKDGILNTLIFRSGIYYNKINNNSNLFDDYGLTIGFGLEYFNNKSIIDIGIKYGKRNSTVFNLNNEKYIELIIGITSSDKWFIKRKRK